MLLDELPLEDGSAEVVLRGRAEVKEVLDHVDDRLLVIVGPVLASTTWTPRTSTPSAWRRRRRELEDDLCVAMRVYFEKPRTTTGWKGLINDPGLDDSGDVNRGFLLARRLLLEVLELGLPVGCEWLDPITPQYISDLVAWGAIGARTTESQIHRQLGIRACRCRSGSRTAPTATSTWRWTPCAPRPSRTCSPASIPRAPRDPAHQRQRRLPRDPPRGSRRAQLRAAEHRDARSRSSTRAGLPRRVIVDASHDNSGKDHERQPRVVDDIAAQVAGGSTAIVGVMLESFLVAGSQPLGTGRGLSTASRSPTSAWTGTPPSGVLDGLAAAVRARRAA